MPKYSSEGREVDSIATLLELTGLGGEKEDELT